MTDTANGTSIVMPKLGLTMSEGMLSEWHVAPGDDVLAGQLLFVVETDKISSEVEAPGAGRILKLLVSVGDTIEVGVPVATWTGTGQVAPKANAEQVPIAEPSVPAPPSIGTHIRSTPLARRLAKLAGLDITTISGSGPRGRIQACDVSAVVDSQGTAPPRESPKPAQVLDSGRDLRPLIAARVLRSKAEIPHFYVTVDAAFDSLNNLRQALNADPLSPRKLSITAFLGVAVARAIALVPEANVVWRANRADPLDRIAVGIAVDTPGGVMAPVVPAGGGLYRFADALDSAIKRARLGRLNTEDIGAAAIGISNVGMFGVRSLTPIIDPDQTFMLGVGATRSVFRPGQGGAPVVIQEATLSLACDHRAIDGAGAARFLATISELIEQPGRLLIPS